MAIKRRRYRAPRSLKITGSGRTYLVLTLGVGLGALNTGNNLLYLVLGLQLATIVVSGILSERVLRHLRVRRLGSDAAFAQEPFPYRWAVTSTKGTAYALTLTEDGAPLAGEAKAAVLLENEERVMRGMMTAPNRGPLKLTGVRVTTSFPLGLFAKTRIFDLEETLLVYPRRIKTQGHRDTPNAGPLGDKSDPRHSDGDGELHSLRPLRPGEDARRVHWTKSASAGELLRIEREREQKQAYVLTVPAAQTPEELDRRCEEVASAAQRLLGAGHPVGLEAASMRLRAATGVRHEHRLLRALALLGHEELVP